MAVWIIRDAWELGYEYECSYCHKLIDVRHKGVDLPVKCPYCGEKVGDKDAEYIKREALLKEAAKNRAIGLCEADIVDIRGLINAQPTADVVEVVHSYQPGDVCIYGFGDENKSCSIVEIVRVLSDERGVAEVKFLKVFVDDTGNGYFSYLLRSGNTMNASFKYLKNITPRMDGESDG